MIYVVGKEGLEPSLLQQKLDFESSASTIPPLTHRVIFYKKNNLFTIRYTNCPAIKLYCILNYSISFLWIAII